MASTQLDTVLTEERQQAAADRQALLSQITALISNTGEVQDARLDKKIASVRNGITASTATFEAARSRYGEGMDTWSQKESSLVGEVLKSRDTLKSKLKKDWMVSNR